MTNVLLILLYLLIDAAVGYLIMMFFIGKPKTDQQKKKFRVGLATWVVLGIIGVVFFRS